MKTGCVATGHPCVSESALEVLGAGGNAVDAAIAAGFASAVVEPTLTSLGGGGFLLARMVEGPALLFDFFVDTPGRGLAQAELEPHFVPVTVRFPASEQVFNVGLGSVAVPGNLRGFLHAHARLGRLALREIVKPAVALASRGSRLNHHQAYFLTLLHPIMTLTETGRSLFAPGGTVLREGERYANPDLAAFLAELPSGAARDFHEGALARRIAADMRDGQGLLTESDLAGFAVVERAPLSVDYRGHQLLTNPPPASGGTLIAVALALLESLPRGEEGPDSPRQVLGFVAAMQEVERLREAGPSNLAGVDPKLWEAARARVRRFSRGTTHMSVCDAAGNVASLTTSNGEGSGYIAPGTGIMLNNMLGEDDLHPDGFHSAPPGERVSSMMAPSVLLRGGRVRLVLGSGGSKRIRSAMTQVIRNVVDFALPVAEAVERPRMHWDGQQLQVEPGVPAETLEVLRSGWPVNVWSQRDVYFGGVHAVAPDGEGAGDPRRGGHSARD